jgi:hypothetical protein
VSVSFNISKDKVGLYYDNARTVTNAALVFILLKSTGIEADATLADHDDVASLLAGTSDECDFTNYARKTLSGSSTVRRTVDDTNNRVLLDADDITWVDAGAAGTTAGSGAGNNNVARLLVAYDPDTTTGTDGSLIPLTTHDITVATDGNDVIIRFHVDGTTRVL